MYIYIYIYIYPGTRVSSFPELISVARVNEKMLYIYKITVHNGKKPAPLIDFLRSFLISILKLFREINFHLFLPERFPIVLGSHRRCFQNHETFSSQKVSCNLYIYVERKIEGYICRVLLCFLCKNISHNFTRIAMFYVNHLYVKHLYIHSNQNIFFYLHILR